MGRRPSPAAIRDQKAPVRSTRAAPASAVMASGSIEPPAWLVGDGLGVWERLAPILGPAKLLTAGDVATFARYCRNFGLWLKMRAELDDEGFTYVSKSKHGDLERVKPAYMIADRAERQLLAAEDRFGLNPSARQSIMAARSQTGKNGDLFSDPAPAPAPREGDPATPAAAPAAPIESPVGMLN